MGKFKRLLLSLSLALVCCVGYLSVGSLTTYAAESAPFYAENMDAFTWGGEPTIYFRDVNKNNLYSGTTTIYSDYEKFGTQYISWKNPQMSNVSYFYLGVQDGYTTPMLVPSLYDYYLVSVGYGTQHTSTDFSFVPDKSYVTFNDCDGSHQHYLEDVSSSHFDTGTTTAPSTIGFVTVGKIPEGCESSIINYVGFVDSQTGSICDGGFRMFFRIAAVEKNTSADVSNAILSRLDTLINETQNVESAISQMEQTIKETLEEQYEMDEEEDFGVEDITSSVEEKMGVLTFTSDTLVSFLDLFSAESSGGTQLTFPGFKLNMGNGETYQVWPDYTYDLKELEQHFGFLINTVRTITVLCVWLALFKYLGKAYEHFINKR